MRNIVMVGNCQIETLRVLYLRFARRFDEKLTYIRSYESLTDADRKAIERADLLIEQVQDFQAKAATAEVETLATKIKVPVVSAGFLWPFAGQTRPDNPVRPWREVGPYGAEMSDGFLNRMIRKKTKPAQALKEYLALDVNAMVNLDRLLEMSLERQRERDTASEFQIATLIETNFRQEALFRTPYHPGLRVTLALASQLFEKMGAEPAHTAQLNKALKRSPFPEDELPLHPKVSQHFGLRWAGKDRRYRFMSEGSFTFREYVSRYMLGSWNEALEHGITLVAVGKLADALPLLETGLSLTPDSAGGFGALASVLDQQGKFQQAAAAIAKAVSLDPEHAAYRAQCGVLLWKNQDFPAAEEQLMRAVALDPHEDHYYDLAVKFMRASGQADKILSLLQTGLRHNPRSEKLGLALAENFELSEEIQEAEIVLDNAVHLATDPRVPLRALINMANRHDQDNRAAAFTSRLREMEHHPATAA